jgi:murein DD-endopeptidase MepM/ murein hydrolase activator NlpD
MLLLALLLVDVAPAAPAADAIRVTTGARAIQPGEIVLFTMTVPEHTDLVQLRAFNRDIAAYKVDETTWRAILGIDLGVAPGSYPVAIEARGVSPAAKLTYGLRVTSRTFLTRRLLVDPAFVNPPASAAVRISHEAAEIAAIWRAPANERLWSGPFVRPVPGAANSAFGTRSIFNGRRRDPHSGGDFLSPEGTPIQAPGAGRVVLAENLYFLGNTVIIDHGLGLFSLLAHMSEMDVKPGYRVNAGEIVGKVGATGRVTGPHLHWAVRASGARVDPLSVLEVLGAAP